MPTINIPGGKIYFEVKGQGEPIVILRGLGRSIRYWMGFDDFLAERFQVISIDNRGIGRSTGQVSWFLSIRDMARDVIRVLDHLSIDQAHIMGTSLGGMIALEAGLTFPSRCRTVIPINTSIVGFDLRMKIPAILACARHGRDPEKMTHKLGQLLVDPDHPEDSRSELVEEWLKIVDEEGLPRSIIIKQLLAAARFHVRGKLANLKPPCLVIYGSGDRFVPVINSMKVHFLIPGAELKKVDGAGHEAMFDKPEAIRDHIVEFALRHPCRVSHKQKKTPRKKTKKSKGKTS